jgi:hypothetical protein
MSKLLLAMVVLAAIPAMMMAYPAVGTPAPNFTLHDSAGVSHSLSDYHGKVVFLLFWEHS